MRAQTFDARIQPIVDEQGWDDNTVLGLALDYISNQQSDDAFIDFLRETQDSENEARTVIVTCYADATVKETWTLSVPKDLEVDEDNALDLLGDEQHPGVRIVRVEDDLSDEHDRTIVSIVEEA